jgi:hypothetical protein
MTSRDDASANTPARQIPAHDLARGSGEDSSDGSEGLILRSLAAGAPVLPAAAALGSR